LEKYLKYGGIEFIDFFYYMIFNFIILSNTEFRLTPRFFLLLWLLGYIFSHIYGLQS